MRLCRPSLLVAAIAHLVACGPSPASSTDEEPAAPPPAVPAIDRGPGPSATDDPLGAALHRTTLDRAGEREEVDEEQRVMLTPGESWSFPFTMFGTWCYVVLAEGGPGVQDVDLLLVDSNGVPVQRDRETGPAASLGLGQNRICVLDPGQFTLQVRAARGSGQVAFRVFRDRIY